MNLYDLETAINILYNPQNHQQSVITQASDYCKSFVTNNTQNLADFFSLFTQNQNQLTKFWLLQSIGEIIRQHYEQVMPSQDQKSQIHEIYINVLKVYPNTILNQKHLMSKYALIFILLLEKDFPQFWPNAFQQIISLVNIIQDQNLQKQYMSKNYINLTFFLEFIITVLTTFEEELIERQEQKDPQIMDISNRVKDGIREFAINDIIFVLQQALMNYQVFDEDTINQILKVYAQLIDWNLLELFGQSIDLFKGLLKLKQFQNNALKCLHAIVYKGMEYSQKIELIVNLQFMEILESFNMKFKERSEDEDFEEQNDEELFFTTVSEAVDKLGQWCLELFMNQDKLLQNQQHQQQYEIIFGRCLQLTVKLLDTDKPKIGRPILEFLKFWLQSLKKLPQISDFQQQLLQQLFNVIVKRAAYPTWFKFDDQEGSEHEEDYILYREELSNVFLNIAAITVKPFYEIFLQTFDSLFKSINPNQTSFHQAEVILFLCYHFYQVIPGNMRDQQNNIYYELMQNLIKIDFMKYDQTAINLMFLENIVIYSSYFINNQNFSEWILQTFFSKKSILCNDPKLAKRSCYLLLRLCEKPKVTSQLLPQTNNIIQCTMQVIQAIEQGKNQILTFDELIQLYNIISIFTIDSQPLQKEEKLQIQQEIMNSFLQRLNSCQPFEKDKIVCILKLINVYTKRMQHEIQGDLKLIFIQILQQAIGIMIQNLNITNISDEVFQFLQRNIVLLGTESLTYLLQLCQPDFIQNTDNERLEQIINVNQSLIINFLQILNFSVINQKQESLQLINQLFGLLFQKISEIQVPINDTSDIQKNNIKTISAFFKLIGTCAEIDCSFIFSSQNAQHSGNFLKFLFIHFEQNIDKTSKKGIVQILKDMFIDFSGLKSNPQLLTQFNKKNLKDTKAQIKDNSNLIKMFPTEYNYLLQNLLTIVCQQIFILNPTNLEDSTIIKNITEIQALFILAGFTEQILQVLQYQQIDQSIQQMIIQLCGALNSKQVQLRQFHENYLVIYFYHYNSFLQKLLTQLKKQK